MKLENQVFNFWKGNKVDGFFQLTQAELIEKFNAWIPTKDRSWLDYYGISECVQVFVSENLNAIGNTENDFAEYRTMEIILKPIRKAFLDPHDFDSLATRAMSDKNISEA